MLRVNDLCIPALQDSQVAVFNFAQADVKEGSALLSQLRAQLSGNTMPVYCVVPKGILPQKFLSHLSKGQRSRLKVLSKEEYSQAHALNLEKIYGDFVKGQATSMALFSREFVSVSETLRQQLRLTLYQIFPNGVVCNVTQTLEASRRAEQLYKQQQ